MEPLFSLFGGSGAGGAYNAGDGMNAATGGLNYLGNGPQTNPPNPAQAASNPNYGPAQGGPSFGQFMGNLATQLQQKSAVGGGGGMAAPTAPADSNSAASANAGQAVKGIAGALSF